ncbi:MAG TPA: transporter [Oculatellaceae cyanobacterium]
MSKFVSFAVGAIVLLIGQPSFALEQSDDIDTNRPSFMDSPLVVPKGSLQLENGTLYQHFQHGKSVFDMPETEVRYGIFKSTEFQAFVPNYNLFHQQSSARTDTSSQNSYGVSDIQEAGLKIQLPEKVKDLRVSVIGGVTIPTGRRLINTGGVQPVFRVPWGKKINDKWSIMGMQSILVLNSGRDVEWQNFWMLNRSIGTRSSVFAEYGGFYTHHAVWSNIAHFGAVRKLTKCTQIDMQWGVGLNKTAPAAFVGAGYSFRFDKLPW